VGATLTAISIILDEGTDSTSTDDPAGIGLGVIDNIFIDGTFIRKGAGTSH
jgi:hypothetical protein